MVPFWWKRRLQRGGCKRGKANRLLPRVEQSYLQDLTQAVVSLKNQLNCQDWYLLLDMLFLGEKERWN